MIVGIDLGTTNSLVAFHSPEGPRLIPNVLGDMLTPSVVGIDLDGQVLVGRSAKEFQVLHPERCAATFKRSMGTDWQVRLADQTLSAVDLSSLVLKSLKGDAEAYLQRPITEAVITVPAYFNELQRTATMRAGKMAGFDVKRILNEPTAAAIAYGVHEVEDDKVILIFDLGGGTFDVSILERFEGTLEIRSSAGEIFLGGEDFTNAMSSRILQTQGLIFEKAELEFPLLVSRLRHECEAAKRVLSRGENAVIRVPSKSGDISDSAVTVTVRREDFEAWTDHILTRVDSPLRRALGDARLQRQDIDEIILVGGATRMPSVRERVTAMFNKPPKCSLNPDEVVALGAAIQAGLVNQDSSLDDLVVTDVAPFTLGVEVGHDFAGQIRNGYFSPIINRNTTIPVSRTEKYCTLHPSQTVVNLKLYQGESRRVDGNLFLGEFEVKGIPPSSSGPHIEVRFTYDLNGILEVEATILQTGRKVTHLVTRFAKGLNEEEIAKAVSRMQALKINHRDEAVNRYVLRWSERVFQELPLRERQLLESLIQAFEVALEMNDRNLIDECRTTLENFLKQVSDEPDAPDDWS